MLVTFVENYSVVYIGHQAPHHGHLRRLRLVTPSAEAPRGPGRLYRQTQVLCGTAYLVLTIAADREWIQSPVTGFRNISATQVRAIRCK